MSCYFRHLKPVFDEAGITVTPDNRKRIDQVIHQLVQVDYKECPSAWKALKQQVLADDRKRQEFLGRLRDGMQ
ncbi:MAG: hypothetical protein V3R87_07650 [Dehalococcoidia bacterium]